MKQEAGEGSDDAIRTTSTPSRGRGRSQIQVVLTGRVESTGEESGHVRLWLCLGSSGCRRWRSGRPSASHEPTSKVGIRESMRLSTETRRRKERLSRTEPTTMSQSRTSLMRRRGGGGGDDALVRKERSGQAASRQVRVWCGVVWCGVVGGVTAGAGTGGLATAPQPV